MLVVISDIHVLGSQLMSTKATIMQDLASEFSKKNSGGNTPRLPQREGRPPPAPTQSPASGRAQAPRCWDPILGPPQLFSRGCAPGYNVEQRMLGCTDSV